MPGEHARSDSQPIWISAETLSKSGPDDSCTLACFQTGSVWLKPNSQLTPNSQPEPDQIWAAFAQYGIEDCNQVWKWETGSRPVAFWQNQAWQFLHTGLLLDRMQSLARSDLGQFYKIWSRSSLEEWNQIRCRKLDPAYTILPDYSSIWPYQVGSSLFTGCFAMRSSHSSGYGAVPSCLFLAVWWRGVQW